MSDFVSIARIVKARGVRGEVAAQLLTDFPERFRGMTSIRISGPQGVFEEILDRHWFHKNRVILKFQGRDTPEAVLPLIQGELQIPEEERYPLPEGSFYHSDLVGCRVLEGKKNLGTVSDVLEIGAGISNLIVRNESGQEWMLPLVGAFIEEIDVAGQVVQASPPPELLDLAVENKPGKKKLRARRRRLGKTE